jgi:16S rRNA U516 pseudouridylate synthase RsuA-like enzyme
VVVLVDLVEKVGFQVGELERVRFSCVILELSIPVLDLKLFGIIVELTQTFTVLLL